MRPRLRPAAAVALSVALSATPRMGMAMSAESTLRMETTMPAESTLKIGTTISGDSTPRMQTTMPAGSTPRMETTMPIAPAQRADLTALREAYLAAVGDADAIPRGLDEIARLRRGAPAAPEMDALLTAYEGALVTLRAKHAFWPAQKMRHMRAGLALLDRAVAAFPDGAEARYLRLMSCYYLPGFFGRGGSVRDDFAALGHLLPRVRERYPADLYQAIARFVVEKGKLAPEPRAALEATLVPNRA